MGGVLVGGGLVGSFIGVQIFALLRTVGQADLAIALLYVVLLGSVGLLMRSRQFAPLSRRGGPGATAGRARRTSTPGCTTCPGRCASASAP
jgi:hypothetical protein